jgi:hypothetical protein
MRSIALVFFGVLLTGAAPPAAPAAAKAPAPPRAVSSSLSGTSLTVTWKRTTGGIVQARVKTTITTAAGRTKSTIAARPSAKGSKGRLTITVKGARGTAFVASFVRVQVRRCLGSGKAKRCSAYSAWKQPKSAALPGPVETPSPQAAPAPSAPVGDVPSIGGCPVLPADHAFNQDVSGLPLDPKSDAYLSFIGTSRRVHPDFGSADLGQGPGGFGIPYRVVPRSQPFVKTTFGDYADESDTVPNEIGYPVPLDSPIEGGPNADGDRHVLVVRQEECKLYEMGNAYPRDGGWDASGGAIWDLSTGKRPASAQTGWTSADAAGLPILPGLVRYDEVAAGVIKHAVRFTVSGTQRGFVAPASHFAPTSQSPDAPPMGLRLRMRADFDTSRFTGQSLVVVVALKKYGMIVADNGSDWYLSGAADPRWDDEDLNQLKAIPGSAFEVVKTGPVVTSVG